MKKCTIWASKCKKNWRSAMIHAYTFKRMQQKKTLL